MSDERTESGTASRPNCTRFGRNVVWNVFGNTGGKVVGPLLQLLIARFLVPEDYGAFAIVMAWLAMFEIVKDGGLTQAIIVRQEGSNAVYVQFTAQLAIAAIFYLGTLLTTPLAVRLFDSPQLAYVFPLAGLVAFVTAVADPIITECLTAQHYRRIALRQLLVPLASGTLGLFLAYQGLGVYALVFGLLFGNLLGAAVLYIGRKARLRVLRDWVLLRDLLRVGKHIVLQRFFGFLVGHADSFIVGSVLGSQSLGLYRVAHLLAYLVPGATITQAQQVVFTELSADGNPTKIRQRYEFFTNAGGALLLLYSVAVYLAAPVVVPLVLGRHWEQMVPLIQILAVVVVPGFLTPLNMDLAKILGFVRVYTHFSAVRSFATIMALVWAAHHSVLHVVMAWVAVGLLATLLNDVIFYLKQDVVRPTKGKVFVTAACWAWAGYVVSAIA